MKPLEQRIVEFCLVLRRFHINVSHSMIADTLEAVALVGLERDVFYHTLKATLIKDHADLSVFVSLFRIFFGEKPDSPPDEDTGDPYEGPEDNADDGRESGRVEGANSPGVITEQRAKSRLEGEPHVLLVKAVREGDYDMLQLLAHQAVENLGVVHPNDITEIKMFVKKAQHSLGWNKALEELFSGLMSPRAQFF